MILTLMRAERLFRFIEVMECMSDTRGSNSFSMYQVVGADGKRRKRYEVVTDALLLLCGRSLETKYPQGIPIRIAGKAKIEIKVTVDPEGNSAHST